VKAPSTDEILNYYSKNKDKYKSRQDPGRVPPRDADEFKKKEPEPSERT